MCPALICLLLTMATVHLKVDATYSGVTEHAGIVVSAAISLTDALTEVDKAYRAAGGGPVRFNFVASNVLARQIVNGAPADVFISADEAQMDYAQKAGAIDAASRIALLGNRLAVVTPAGRPLKSRDAQALTNATVKRVALGDPAAVPAGVYAKQYLERINLWTALQPKLLPLANVRAALAAAESGGADAAIVYESDVASTRRVDLAFVIDGPDAPRIVYPAAIVATTRQRASALKFLAFLRGPQARDIFRRFKFGIPPSDAGVRLKPDATPAP